MDPWLERLEERREQRKQASRTVPLLGEELTVKASIAPEVGLRITKLEIQIAEHRAAVADAEKEGKPRPLVGVTDIEVLDVIESVIRDCLEPAALPVWAKLRDPAAPEPLDFEDLYLIAKGLVATVVGLPTGGPTDSSAGQGSGKRSSKARSSSRAAARKP